VRRNELDMIVEEESRKRNPNNYWNLSWLIPSLNHSVLK
jgi:hypothetical protein